MLATFITWLIIALYEDFGIIGVLLFLTVLWGIAGIFILVNKLSADKYKITEQTTNYITNGYTTNVIIETYEKK